MNILSMLITPIELRSMPKYCRKCSYTLNRYSTKFHYNERNRNPIIDIIYLKCPSCEYSTRYIFGQHYDGWEVKSIEDAKRLIDKYLS